MIEYLFANETPELPAAKQRDENPVLITADPKNGKINNINNPTNKNTGLTFEDEVFDALYRNKFALGINEIYKLRASACDGYIKLEKSKKKFC